MSRRKKLLKDSLIYSLGEFVPRLVSFLLVPVLTFYVGAAELGEYDMIMAAQGLLVPVLSLQLETAAYRYMKAGECDREVTMSTILLFVFAVAAGLILIGSLWSLVPASYRYASEVAILLATSMVSGVMAQLYRGLGFNRVFASFGVVRAVLMGVFSLLLLASMEHKVAALLWAAIGSSVGGMGYLLVMGVLQNFSVRRFEWGELQRLWTFSFPLIPNAVSWWALNSANRIVTASYLGLAAAGTYSVAMKFSSLVVLLQSLFGMAWQDTAIDSRNDTDRAQFFGKAFQVYYTGLFIIVLAMICFNRVLFSLAIDPKFRDAAQYAPLFYIGTLFSSFSSFFGSVYIAQGRTKPIIVTTLLGSLFGTAVAWVCVPRWGMYGAAVGFVGGFLVTWISRLLHTQLFFDMAINQAELLGFLGLVVAATWLGIYDESTVSGSLCSLCALSIGWMLVRLWRLAGIGGNLVVVP